MSHYPGPTPGPLPHVPKGRFKPPFIERMFPIDGERVGDKSRMSGEIPWALAELVFTVYPHPEDVTLEDVAEQGGWTWSEMANLMSLLPERAGPLPISCYVGNGGKRRPPTQAAQVR